jgi:hypothetical protein
MIIRVLRVLLGLGGVLFALGMVILALRLGGCTMRLCSRFVVFRGLAVCVFHVDFSCWPTNFGYPQRRQSIVAEQSANLVLVEKLGPPSPISLQLKFSTRPCGLVSVPQIHGAGRRWLARELPTKRRHAEIAVFLTGGVDVIG